MPETYKKGLEEIALIDPESGLGFIEELKKVSPDFADYFVSFAFGSVYSRSILEPKVKELIIVANLIALGDSKSHLKIHMLAAMRMGCSKEEILEVVIQSIVYVGFTRAISALNLVKTVLERLEKASPDKPKTSKTTR